MQNGQKISSGAFGARGALGAFSTHGLWSPVPLTGGPLGESGGWRRGGGGGASYNPRSHTPGGILPCCLSHVVLYL